MSRALPADVAGLILPIPDEFTPTFGDRGYYVRWGAIVDVTGSGPLSVELGYSKASGKADDPKERANLRADAWQVTELARLGRGDLLAYCTVGRHKRG